MFHKATFGQIFLKWNVLHWKEWEGWVYLRKVPLTRVVSVFPETILYEAVGFCQKNDTSRTDPFADVA